MVTFVARCGGCREQITWATTDAGKNMPCDPPSESGNLWLWDEGNQRRVSTNRPPPPARPIKVTSHYATCEKADDYRRKGKKR